MSFVFSVMSCSRRERERSGPSRRLSPSPYPGPTFVPSPRLPMAGRVGRETKAVRRGRAGPVRGGARETGVDRTPQRPGHALAETPEGSTVPLERWTGTRQGGRLRARPQCGASTTESSRPLDWEMQRRQEPTKVPWLWKRVVSGMLAAPVRPRVTVT